MRDEWGLSSTPIGDMDGRLFVRDQADIPEILRGILFGKNPDRVVIAHSRDEVVSTVRYAFEHESPIVPRGGATSPYGGIMPVKGGIVLDLSHLTTVMETDVEKGTVRVEAGVRWAQLDEEQLNGGRFAELGERDWKLIEPYLRENERLFGIPMERLLTVNGKKMSPYEVYRKVEAVPVKALAALGA